MGEESNEGGFSVEDELKGIQERLKKLPFQMKLEGKEVLRQLAFPETTMMSPPPRKVPTKGAKKKVDIARSKGKITSTSRIPYSWEVVDSQNPDSQPSPSPTTSSFKRKKVLVLVKSHFPYFHHLLGIQSLRLFRFQRLIRFLIICQSSWFHLLKKWWML